MGGDIILCSVREKWHNDTQPQRPHRCQELLVVHAYNEMKIISLFNFNSLKKEDFNPCLDPALLLSIVLCS